MVGTQLIVTKTGCIVSNEQADSVLGLVNAHGLSLFDNQAKLTETAISGFISFLTAMELGCASNILRVVGRSH
jgi:hypothetical protein